MFWGGGGAARRHRNGSSDGACSKENQRLEGLPAHREAFVGQLGDAFPGHAATGDVGIFEVGVGSEAVRQGFYGVAGFEAGWVVGQIDLSEARVDGKRA